MNKIIFISIVSIVICCILNILWRLDLNIHAAIWERDDSETKVRDDLIAFENIPLSMENDSIVWKIDPIHISKSYIVNSTESDVKLFKSKRIVFIGDSTVRYQYLNFVQFFHHNDWDNMDDSNPNPEIPVAEWEGGWPSWKEFCLSSAARFGCQMICDCYRYKWPITDRTEVKENRHYYHPRLKLFIHYFQWFPGVTGTALVGLNVPTKQDFVKRCQRFSDSYLSDMLNFLPKHDFMYQNVTDFIVNVVKPLTPDFLIVNQGIWGDASFRTPISLKEFAKVATSSARRAIWRKTIRRCDYPSLEHDPSEMLQLFSSGGMNIFDTSLLTRDIVKFPSACWDSLHLKAFVNREINKQLIMFLQKLI